LIPPDHVNPKLSAGISEVIEMMMAKNPRDRYQHCRDLLVDLRAVRTGQTPPIAHRDIGGDELATLAQAEAAAPTEIREETRDEATVAMPLFAIMVALLVISVVFNLIQFFGRG
jgi:serine/threonine-protein kinase